MNGADATMALRRLGFTIPIIALTAYSFVEDEMQCAAVGFTGE